MRDRIIEQDDGSEIDPHANDGADKLAGFEPVLPDLCTGLADHERIGRAQCMPVDHRVPPDTAGEELQHRPDVVTQR